LILNILQKKKKSSSSSSKSKSKSKSKIKFTISPFQSQLLVLFNQKDQWEAAEMCKILFPTGAQLKEEEIFAALSSALSPLIFDPKGPIALVPTEEDKIKLEELKKASEEKKEEGGGEGGEKKKSSSSSSSSSSKKSSSSSRTKKTETTTTPTEGGDKKEETGEGGEKKKSSSSSSSSKKKSSSSKSSSSSKKEPQIPERDLTLKDVFFLKKEIDSSLLRIQYETESSKKKEKGNEQVDKYVRKKREFMLDAAMVRVMKARNAIKWTQFQTEVLKLVQKEWTPSAKEMKKRLGSLMERDFIKRSEEDENLLQYIA